MTDAQVADEKFLVLINDMLASGVTMVSFSIMSLMFFSYKNRQ